MPPTNGAVNVYNTEDVGVAAEGVAVQPSRAKGLLREHAESQWQHESKI